MSDAPKHPAIYCADTVPQPVRWVPAEDLARTQARIEALEAQIAEARELLREFVAAYPYEDMGHVAVIHDDARALLARMGD
jgi:hypothetical protein